MSKPTNTTRIAVLETTAIVIKDKIKCFVTIDRFNPIEKIVWGLSMAVLLSVVGAGLALILR